MNGVNDKIIMSFEVNTVSIDTVMYKYKNSLVCPVRARLSATLAKNLKKPSSSRNMDSTVMDRNSARILSGFIAVSAISALPTVSSLVDAHANTITAPKSVISQYVSSLTFPSLSLGKNSIASIITTHVIEHKTIGSTIASLCVFTKQNLSNDFRLIFFCSSISRRDGFVNIVSSLFATNPDKSILREIILTARHISGIVVKARHL